MSTTEWGTLVDDWTHIFDEDDEDDRDDRLDEEPGRWQEVLDCSVYADSSMTIPGKGEPADSCGEWFPHEFCDSCGEPHFGKTHCENRECPDCYGIWTRDRAKGITERLAGGRYVEEPGIDRRAVHAVMSPPEGEIQSLNDVYSGFSDAYRLAEEKGVRGGVAVFHGFRVRKEIQEEYTAVDPDMGIWQWVREERPERWRSLTYWSPHYHIIGLCRDFEADDLEEQDGWVARRIRSLSPYEDLSDMEAYDDMVGAARYILSHATFEGDSQRDCVRWFGELATTNFRPEEQLSEEALTAIEKRTEEAVGGVEEDVEDSESEENEECEECGSRSRSPIWDAGDALQDRRWCERIGREQQQRLTAAFEWAIGEREPPPGMKHPRTEAEAEECLETLL